MSLVDSHCHLDSREFAPDRDEVIARALEAGVDRLMVIGTGDGPPDLGAGIRLADRFDHVFCTIGVHPHDASKAEPGTWRAMEDLVKHPKVLAIGEMGLDYHYDFSPRETQRQVFVDQMTFARSAGKPIVIHTREAWDDTFELLERHWAGSPYGGIMHCFSGGPDEASRALKLGFYLSFAGVLTFPKALNVQAAAREAPLDRILVETDAPYLAPVPNRGKRNEPAFVVQTARRLAELRGVSFETITAATSNNFERLCLPAAATKG